MTRVRATPTTFSVGNYQLTNEALNFGDVFYIQKVKHRPIGTKLLLFAIRFENLDAKNHYWYYPDQATRDADYDRLDTITHSGNGSAGGLDPNASTKDKQEELILKVQQLIDKPERSDIVLVGIDSAILNQINFGPASHRTFGVGGGAVPQIIQDSKEITWTSTNPNHQIIIPFDHVFQSKPITAYFEFESLNSGVDNNQFNFYFRESTQPVLIPPAIISKVFPINDKKQIIELKFDNTTTNYQQLQLIIHPHYLTNTNYPSTYRLRPIGFLPDAFSPTDFIKQQLVFENSILTQTNYLDADNQAYMLRELFIPDNNFPVERSNAQLLKELIETVKKSDYEKVLAADDYTPTAVVLDLGLPNERLESITHNSPSLGIQIKETFNYQQRPDGTYLALPPSRIKL